jgi:hypothetical protein
MSGGILWSTFADESNPDREIRYVTDNASDGDVIRLRESDDQPSNRLVIVLTSEVKWWKGIEVYDQNGNLLGAVYTSGKATGPITTSISLDGVDLSQSNITWLKAKLFGVHTGMYIINNIESKRGKTLNFTWHKDG